MKAEDLDGSPFHEEYISTAPRPEDWPRLVAKVMRMNSELVDWPAEAVRSIKAPTLIIIGDADIVQPEQAVEMFRLLGGGVMGDMVGLPSARLAVLPGTTHVTVAYRGEWLASMINEFLDEPMPAEK